MGSPRRIPYRETEEGESSSGTRGKILVLVGATAVGKTRLSLKIAARFNAEIVSADSMQIYRGMDIGTAKPTQEERGRVPHHLIDILAPDDAYNAARYQREADRVLADIQRRERVPLVAGGTGLYIKALLHGLFPDGFAQGNSTWKQKLEAYRGSGEDPYQLLVSKDPDAARTIHPNDSVRAQRALEVYLRTGKSITAFQKKHGFLKTRYNACLIGLALDRERLYERINTRVDEMIRKGFLEEVRGLLESGYAPDLPSMLGLGYRHMVRVLQGHDSLSEGIRLLKRDTRHYAKRQTTWFKNQEEVSWYEASDSDRRIFNAIQRFLD